MALTSDRLPLLSGRIEPLLVMCFSKARPEIQSNCHSALPSLSPLDFNTCAKRLKTRRGFNCFAMEQPATAYCPSSVKNWVKGLLLGTRCWNPESCWLIFSYPMPRMLDLCHIMKWAKKTNSLVYLQYIYISSYGRKSGTNQQSWNPGVLQKDHISSSPVVHPMSNTFIQHSLKNSKQP